MSRRTILLLAVLMGSRSASGQAPPAGDTGTISYTTSGVRVIQRLAPGTGLVAVRLLLLGGSRQLTPSTQGMEALLLEAATHGSARFPGDSTTRAMALTGGVEVSGIDRDWSEVGFTTLSVTADDAWAVFADRVVAPELSDSALARARRELIVSAHDRYIDPDTRIILVGDSVLFRGHPYALDPEGTEATLRSIPDSAVRAYQTAQVTTSRLLLIVVGHATRSQVERWIAGTLGRLPAGGYQWSLPPRPKVARSHWLLEQRSLPTNYVLGLFVGPSAGTDDYWPFRVAMSLLGGDLFEAVRIENGLSYAPNAPFFDYAQTWGGVYASTRDPAAVARLMGGSMIRLQVINGFGWGYEYRRMLRGFTYDYLQESSTVGGQADLLARAELFLGDYRRVREYGDRLSRVDIEDVRAAAMQYFKEPQFVMLGDTTLMRGW